MFIIITIILNTPSDLKDHLVQPLKKNLINLEKLILTLKPFVTLILKYLLVFTRLLPVRTTLSGKMLLLKN